MALTPKQQRFCEEYLVDLNATQAAIRAGYSEKSAKEIGCQNLTKLNIQKKISELKKEHSERTGITIDRILNGLASIAFSDIRKLFLNGSLVPVQEWDDETAAAVAGLDVVTVSKGEGEVEYVAKVKTNDRLRALDKLYNHLTGTDDNPGATVNINIKSNHALDAVIDSLTSDED